MVKASAFKAYDVRGLYPEEFDAAGAERVAAAFVAVTGARRVAVGRDTRLTSPEITEAVIEGLSGAGADVLDIGVVGSEVLYFAVAALSLDGGIEVTASHNPRNYNGLKLVARNAVPVALDSGLVQIRDYVLSGSLPRQRAQTGSVEVIDVLPAYVDRVLDLVDIATIERLKVVLDAGNGAAGPMLSQVLMRLPIEALTLFFEPDGSFPHHEPNPVIQANRETLEAAVRATNADIGVAFDGDADRCVFVDGEGEYIHPDFVSALLIRAMLGEAHGETILYETRTSWAVLEAIRDVGATGALTKAGHAHFKRAMHASGAVFGSEASAHYYFRDFVRSDSSVVAFLWMLSTMSQAEASSAALARPYRDAYKILEEVNVPAPLPSAVFDAVVEAFGTRGAVSLFEGVAVETREWRLSARPSNTEPLVRLNVEARSPSILCEISDELLATVARAVGAGSATVS